MIDATAAPQSSTRPWKRAGLIVLTLLTLVSFAPIISLVIATTAASAFDCRLDEGSVHPCFLGGVDLGEMLYAGGVMGWLMLLTWPGILVSLGIWGWLIGVSITRRLRAHIVR